MAPPRTVLALLALAPLAGCVIPTGDGVVIDLSNDTPKVDYWRVGDPPPELVSVAFGLDGEVRDLRTLRPIAGAAIEVTIDRAGWVRRAHSDGAGRFRIDFSSRGRDEAAEDGGPELFGSRERPPHLDSAEIRIRVTCAGRKPIGTAHRIGFRDPPVLLFLEPLDADAPPRFDCET